MAIRGRKPTATVIKLARGNPGKRALPTAEPQVSGAPTKPRHLKGRAAAVWDEIVARAHWLAWPDGPKAALWCNLHVETEREPHQMTAARIAQYRALGSELGLDVASRARIGASNGKPKTDPADSYFD